MDSRLAKWLALESKFNQLLQLDLSQNNIDVTGYIQLTSRQAVYSHSLKKLTLEGNQIAGSFNQLVQKCQLPELEVLDLNLN